MIDLKIEDMNKLKASEVFLLFALPYLDQLPSDISFKDYQSCCKFCESIWNAMTIKEWPENNGNDYLSEIKLEILNKSPNSKIILKIIDIMVYRKNKFFSNAKWKFEVTVKQSTGKYPYVLRAAIRLPDEMILEHSLNWEHLVLDQSSVIH